MAKKVVEEQVNEQVEEQVNEQVEEQVLPSVTIDKLINNEYNYDMIETYNDNEEIRTIDNNNIVTETEELQYNDVDYSGRGFNSLEDAVKYMNSDTFKNLGDADKNEFKKWLIKED